MSAQALPQRAGSSAFLEGVRHSMPVVVASAPFGILFGALAVGNGLSVFESVLMTATIFGGASQMVGIELFGHHVAPWLIVMSIFAVNFRHVLYSAAIGKYISHWPIAQQAIGYFLLTDPQYAETERKGERGERVQFIWYLGMGLPIYVCWVAEAALGAVFGKLIPDTHAIGLDFLLPIYFLGLVMSFRKRPMWLPVVVASGVASIIAYKTIGSPWHVSVGAVVGILFAAAMPPVKDSGGDLL